MSRIERITTSTSRPDPRYSDIVTGFTAHPLTGDVGRLTEDDAIRASIINCVLTRFGEVPYQHEKYSATAAIDVLIWLNSCVASKVHRQNVKIGVNV